MAEASPARGPSTKPRNAKGANAEKGRPCWSARDDDWPARAWPAGLRTSEPAARPPLRLSCAPRVPHPARALPFRVLVLDTIVCLIHHSSMRAGSRVPRRRQYIEVRFLLHSHPVASVFSCACMMHLIFRVGNERLISFHTPPVARHHDMYVVHTTLLSEAPRRAYDFRRHRRPDWVQR